MKGFYLNTLSFNETLLFENKVHFIYTLETKKWVKYYNYLHRKEIKIYIYLMLVLCMCLLQFQDNNTMKIASQNGSFRNALWSDLIDKLCIWIIIFRTLNAVNGTSQLQDSMPLTTKYRAFKKKHIREMHILIVITLIDRGFCDLMKLFLTHCLIFVLNF